MKKKNIKALALSVAMVSMLALTGCGDDAENTAEMVRSYRHYSALRLWCADF